MRVEGGWSGGRRGERKRRDLGVCRGGKGTIVREGEARFREDRFFVKREAPRKRSRLRRNGKQGHMKGKKKKPGVSVTHLPNPHFPTTRLPECSLLTVLTHFSSTSFNCNEAEGREEVVVLASTADMVGGFCSFFLKERTRVGGEERYQFELKLFVRWVGRFRVGMIRRRDGGQA